VIGVALLAALVTAPLLLGRGFALVADMTFVPRQPWKGEWLGVDGSVPRAVPADALVSVATQVVPGDLLQKAVLLGALLLAGGGMLRLLAGTAPAARFGGAALYTWNAWVFERLAIGHWGLFVGYAALPWVARAAVRVRRDGPPVAGPLVLWLALAGLTSPTGGIIAALTAGVLVADVRRVRLTGAVLLTAVLVNLPWLVPGLVNSTGGSDPAGVRAFAATADTPLGTLGSLATLGGIWKAAAAPGDRSSWVLTLATLAIVVAALAVVVRSPRVLTVAGGPSTGGLRGRLVALAIVSFLLASLPTTDPGRRLLQALVGHLLGAGVLRDSQKWLAPFVLVVALGFGLGLDLLHRRLGRRSPGSASAVAVALSLLPVVLLPSLAWGLAGRLEPVRYPAEWAQVRAVLEHQPADQRRTAVLPWSTYQRYAWNGGRVALDPAIRYFPGQMVTSEDLVVGGGTTVVSDDPVTARIGAAVRSGTPLGPVLAGAGVRYVLVEKSAAGGAHLVLPAGRPLHDGPELALLDLGSPARLARSSRPALVVGADVVTGLGLVLAAGATVRRRRPGSIRYHRGGRKSQRREPD
jgi:hypothetical protein